MDLQHLPQYLGVVIRESGYDGSMHEFLGILGGLFNTHAGWAIIIRSTIVYGFILIAMRLSGKRQLGQMAPFDLVLLILISNAVQNAMIGEDQSITGGIIAATTLILCNWMTSQLIMRWPVIGQVVEGKPTLLIHRGQILKDNLQMEGISAQELQQALRENGILHAQSVYLAILELDGKISVIRDSGQDSETLSAS